MALTRRGKQVAAGLGVAALLGAGVFAFSGAAPEPLRRAVSAVTGDEPDPTCPLTGEPIAGGEAAPERPILAVKVENTDDAYPLAGLDRADVVYEEVVEGGITRFVAIFHCREANRVGPVRSARTTDPKILMPFQEQAVLAYSGAAPKVLNALEAAGIVQLTESTAGSAFARDDARTAPHNLFTRTEALWKAAGGSELPDPASPFGFDEDLPERSRRAASVSIVFSTLSETGWVWEQGQWTRQLGGSPMALESGRPITADNVVIQLVKVGQDTIRDASGAFSPLVEMTGRGKAWVLRGGRAIVGTWERAEEGDRTVFRTKDGEEIALTPGTTWVELVPTDGAVAISR